MAAAIPEAVEAVGGAGAAGAGAAGTAGARSQAAGAYLGGKAQSAGQSAARDITGARLPGDRRYQSAVLAEFVIAVVIVAVSPLVNPPDDGKASPSPYRVNHITKLLAIGAVYFILALLSSGSKGRLAAWFGGLVLLGLGFTQLANGDLTAIFRVFGGGIQGTGPSGATPSEQFPGIAESAAQAAQDVGFRASYQPTPSGQPSPAEQITGQ